MRFRCPLYVLFSLIVVSGCREVGVIKKAVDVVEEASESQKAEKRREQLKPLLTGERLTYYDENETQLKSRVNYKNGIKEGFATDYYPSGEKRLEGTFIGGRKNGQFQWFHKNGKKYRSVTYVDNKKHGSDSTFYNSGYHKSVVPYKNGELQKGTVIWDLYREKVKLPKVLIGIVDSTKAKDKYLIHVRFDKIVKKPKYEVAIIGNGTVNSPEHPFMQLQTFGKYNEGILEIPLQEGYYLFDKLVIRAEGKYENTPFKITHIKKLELMNY